jgi:hypothetical protein
MKTFKKIAIIIVCLVAIGAAVLFYMKTTAEKLTEYDIGGDKVASINAVIGETREVTGINTGTSSDSQHKQYTYKTESMVKDLSTYVDYLRKNGWLVIKDSDFSAVRGEFQIATESVDSGKILLMSIAFEQNKYAIRINKGTGTLTRRLP